MAATPTTPAGTLGRRVGVSCDIDAGSTRAVTGTATGRRVELVGVGVMLSELLDIDVPAWRKQAACRGVDPSLFFPPGDGVHVVSSVYDRARAVCSPCPVQLVCLKEHLDERDGFWGNTSPKERVELRRQRTVWFNARRQAMALPRVEDCDSSVRSGA
ncbi:MAG: WhiB family transcriptional regulator [Actinomycetota bacterium]|nr:WhiB family transcriptional regulator [Actinomycetota bacterium]